MEVLITLSISVTLLLFQQMYYNWKFIVGEISAVSGGRDMEKHTVKVVSQWVLDAVVLN